MTDNQRPEGTAQAEKNEACFPFRMIGVRNEERVLVKENRLRLVKRNAVCPPVCDRPIRTAIRPQAILTTV